MRIITILVAALLCANCGHFKKPEWEPYDCKANPENIICKLKL